MKIKWVVRTLTAIILLAGLAIMARANCGNDNGNGNGCSGDGTPGPQGPAGATGPQGPQGVQGSQGAQGLAGTDGKAGNDGKNGKDGINAQDTPKRALQGELDARLYDGKRTSVYLFDSYGFDDSPGHDFVLGGRNAGYGVKFVIKLGSSYEERMLDKQAKEIRALQYELSHLTR